MKEAAGGIRPAAVRAHRDLGRRCRLLVEHRIGAIGEYRRAGGAQVPCRAERDRVVLTLGGPVHPRALGAVERHFLAIHGEEVLTEELADLLEDVAEAADYGKIAPDGVLRLRLVDDVDDEHRQGADAERQDERVGEQPENLANEAHSEPP